MEKETLALPTEYGAFLEDLKGRIRSAQVRAALAVNQELVTLYWQMGQQILSAQQAKGWGAKVVERLSTDLRKEFPDMKGFSRTNLLYMRSFAEAWPDEQIVQQVAGRIPWFHNCVLIDKVKTAEHRLWYARQTIALGWSRNVLSLQIKSRLHERQGTAVSNFATALPASSPTDISSASPAESLCNWGIGS